MIWELGLFFVLFCGNGILVIGIKNALKKILDFLRIGFGNTSVGVRGVQEETLEIRW